MFLRVSMASVRPTPLRHVNNNPGFGGLHAFQWPRCGQPLCDWGKVRDKHIPIRTASMASVRPTPL